MDGGTYTLFLERTTPAIISVGALGDHRFPAGWYAYTGSARGTGGFARVDRHYGIGTGELAVRHWHVDHLLGDPDTEIRGDVRSPGQAIECDVARDLPDGPVAGFGASDCGCRSHLAYVRDGEELRSAVTSRHRSLGGD